MARQLWPRLTDIFGYRFANQFGTKPNDTWARALIGVSGDRVALVLENLLNDPPEYPPGAAEFRALCLNRPRNEAERRQRAFEEMAAEHEQYAQENRAALAQLANPKSRIRDVQAEHIAKALAACEKKPGEVPASEAEVIDTSREWFEANLGSLRRNFGNMQLDHPRHED